MDWVHIPPNFIQAQNLSHESEKFLQQASDLDKKLLLHSLVNTLFISRLALSDWLQHGALMLAALYIQFREPR